jgi:hypothetical protein
MPSAGLNSSRRCSVLALAPGGFAQPLGRAAGGRGQQHARALAIAQSAGSCAPSSSCRCRGRRSAPSRARVSAVCTASRCCGARAKPVKRLLLAPAPPPSQASVYRCKAAIKLAPLRVSRCSRPGHARLAVVERRQIDRRSPLAATAAPAPRWRRRTSCPCSAIRRGMLIAACAGAGVFGGGAVQAWASRLGPRRARDLHLRVAPQRRDTQAHLLAGDVQQIGGRSPPVCSTRQKEMAILAGRVERVGHASGHALRRIRRQPHRLRDLVGGQKADADRCRAPAGRGCS